MGIPGWFNYFCQSVLSTVNELLEAGMAYRMNCSRYLIFSCSRYPIFSIALYKPIFPSLPYRNRFYNSKPMGNAVTYNSRIITDIWYIGKPICHLCLEDIVVGRRAAGSRFLHGSDSQHKTPRHRNILYQTKLQYHCSTLPVQRTYTDTCMNSALYTANVQCSTIHGKCKTLQGKCNTFQGKCNTLQGKQTVGVHQSVHFAPLDMHCCWVWGCTLDKII